MQGLGVLAVLAILLPQVLRVRSLVRRLEEARGGPDPEAVRAGARSAGRYTAVVLAVLVLSLVVSQLVTWSVEQDAHAAPYALFLAAAVFGVALVVALVLGGVLAGGLGRLRALAPAAETDGSVPVRTAGVMTAAVITCCAFGLAWLGFLFVAANSAIACARDPKCI